MKKYNYLGKYIPICPEQLGGFTTPRLPSEIISGSGEQVLNGTSRVINNQEEDVSDGFIKGAMEVEKLLKEFPIKAAILKERSPSCGVKQIYDGTFKNIIKSGEGVTSALIKQYGIPVYSEEEVNEELIQSILFDNKDNGEA